jgi:RNA polymerase sigma-70 factor (ECF subfamily)
MAGRDGFEALMRAEYAGVLRLVAFVVGDDATARDVTQEAFTRLYVHWPRVRRGSAPGGWVRVVAAREAWRVAQRRAREDVGRSVPEPVAAEGAQRDLDLERAVATLPAKQRAAVALHYLADAPVSEVAAVLGCAEATARVHLHRARLRLAELLREEADDVR